MTWNLNNILHRQYIHTWKFKLPLLSLENGMLFFSIASRIFQVLVSFVDIFSTLDYGELLTGKMLRVVMSF